MTDLPPGGSPYPQFDHDAPFDQQLQAAFPHAQQPAAALTNSVFHVLHGHDVAIGAAREDIAAMRQWANHVDTFGAEQLERNDHHDRHLTHGQVVILIVTIVVALLTVGLGFYFCFTDAFGGMKVNTDMARLITGVAVVGWGAVIVGELLTWYRPWRPADQHADAIEAHAEEAHAPVPGGDDRHPVPVPAP